MDGAFVMETGEIYDFLELVGRNFDHDPSRFRRQPLHRRVLFWFVRRLNQINGRIAARRNAHHHYDISNDLYRRFLDPDMQYSCAYFAEPGMTLEAAQAAKKAHICSKLLLEPGQRVLDIGCGWGGMGLSIAERIPGGEVMGVTLSTEQLAVAQERAQMQKANARFELCDYRDVKGRFDRIVSVGMFEHVGQPNYQEYFDTVARLLTDDGVAVIHSIGRKDEPGVTNPWIAKYIFPAATSPPCRRCCRRSSERGCGSRTWRSCACTTPRPCAFGANGSSANGTRSRGSTTCASAGCSSSTWPYRRSPSAMAATWCSSCSWPSAWTRRP